MQDAVRQREGAGGIHGEADAAGGEGFNVITAGGDAGDIVIGAGGGEEDDPTLPCVIFIAEFAVNGIGGAFNKGHKAREFVIGKGDEGAQLL